MTVSVPLYNTDTRTNDINYIRQRRGTDCMQQVMMTVYRLLADTIIICSIYSSLIQPPRYMIITIMMNSLMLFLQIVAQKPIQSKELKR